MKQKVIEMTLTSSEASITMPISSPATYAVIGDFLASHENGSVYLRVADVGAPDPGASR